MFSPDGTFSERLVGRTTRASDPTYTYETTGTYVVRGNTAVLTFMPGNVNFRSGEIWSVAVGDATLTFKGDPLSGNALFVYQKQ